MASLVSQGITKLFLFTPTPKRIHFLTSFQGSEKHRPPYWNTTKANATPHSPKHKMKRKKPTWHRMADSTPLLHLLRLAKTLSCESLSPLRMCPRDKQPHRQAAAGFGSFWVFSLVFHLVFHLVLLFSYVMLLLFSCILLRYFDVGFFWFVSC